MALPISYLESILHNEEDENTYQFLSEQLRTGEYLVELNTGELVTLNQLTKFYEMYSKNSEIRNSERKSKKEIQVSSKQEVEAVCASSISKPKRARRNNKVKTEKV